MPRKSNVVAVPIEEPIVAGDEAIVTEAKTEAQEMTDVVKAIENEVQPEVTELVKVIEEDHVIITEEAAVKPKAKRAPKVSEAKGASPLPRAKKVAEVAVVEVVQPEEVAEEVPAAKPKAAVKGEAFSFGIPQVAKPKAKRAPRAKKEVPLPDPNVQVHSSTINEVVAEVELPNESSEKKAESAKVECPDCGKSMSAKTLRYSHGPNCLFKKQADKEEADPSKMVTQEMIEAEVQKRMSCAKAERLNRRQKQIESLVASAF
jgi:hypothetical protein